MTESELQVTLVSSPCPEEHTLKLSGKQPSGHVACHFGIDTATSTGHTHPQVLAKMLDRASGTCETREQGEKGIPLLQGGKQQQIVLFIARSATFSEKVSRVHIDPCIYRMTSQSSI